MRKYITSENSGEHISVEFGSEFGPIDIVRILNEIRESETPQLYGTKKGGSIVSKVQIRNSVAYFGCCDGNLYAVDAETGNELWRFPTGDIIEGICVGDEAIYASCFDHNLYAIGFDGKEKWRFRTNGKLGVMPCVSKGRIYFGSEDGNFYCLGKDGKLIWKFPTGEPISGTPAVHKSMVMFSSFSRTFYSLHAESGRVLWKFRASGGISGGQVYKNVIYVPCINNALYALSAEGKLLWLYRFNKRLTIDMKCNPFNDMVFLGGRSGGMFAISVRKRKLVWEFSTQELVQSWSATSNGILYFGCCDNNFYAVDAETGKLIWSFKTNGMMVAGCSVHDGKVYFGSWDCNAYCLDAKTGRLIWKFRTSMSNMSDYEVDMRADKPELSIIVQPPEEVKKEAEKKEERLADYGEFSGSYIDKEKADYVKSGRKGYIKKKDF